MAFRYKARVEPYAGGVEVQFGPLSESAPRRETLYLAEDHPDFGKYKSGEEYIFDEGDEKPKKATRVKAGKKAAKKRAEASEEKEAGRVLDAIENPAAALESVKSMLNDS
jgi:hypothetical protein